MKRKTLQLIAILLSTHLYAQTTIENFSYGAVTGTSADSLTNPAFGGSVWRRHSGTGGPIGYVATSLSFPGYPSSSVGGSARFTFVSTSAEDANRSTTPYTSGNVYVSFLLRVTNNGGAANTGDYFFHLLDTSAITSFRARHYIKIGTVANTYNIGLNKGSSAVPVYSANLPVDSTVLVVVKYSFHPTLLDTVSTFIFPNGTAIPTTEPTTPTLVATDISTADMVTLNAVAIRQGTVGTMSGLVDGIRVANSWTNAPLPVQLTSFNATTIENGTTLLSWTTSSEIDNNGFEIETSVDGITFENIGFVKGSGNSNTSQRYDFNYPYSQTAYYRLKQIDYNGAYTYSNTILVKNDGIDARLNPNPFNENIELTGSVTIQKVDIVDLTGKTLYSETINHSATSINTKDLKNGIYLLKIYTENGVTSKRIVKVD